MVKAYWDYESQFPDNFFAYRFGDAIVDKLLPYIPTAGSVLDYGCGPGNLIEKLLKHDLRVAGLDFSPATREAVIQRFRDDRKFTGAFEPKDLGNRAESFDAVIVVEVVEHLYDAQLDELLNNILKLLRPGGTAIFTTPNEEKLEDSYILCPTSGQLFHRWQHVRSWSSESLGNYLSSHGYELEKCFTTDFCITFNTGNKLKPGKKLPHLVAIANKPKHKAASSGGD